MPDPSEFRFRVNLSIRVFGMDADHHPFSQDAHAHDISDHGARLSGLEKRLGTGDIIGVQVGGKKARCKVIWVNESGPPEKIEAGVKMVEGQACPWEKQRATQRSMASTPIVRITPAARDKRKFRRLRIPFPIEIRDGHSVGTHIPAKTQDIGGRGCYVETLQPLPVNQILDVTFWLNSERVQTPAIVRTCDGGVGMGIEFIGLDESTQKQLQDQVEAMAVGSSLFRIARGAF
jgi:PilZ domain